MSTTDRIQYDTPLAASADGYLSIKEARQYARDTGRGAYPITGDAILDPARDYAEVDHPYDVWITSQSGEPDFTASGVKVSSRYRREQIDALPPLTLGDLND